ncbi:N-acetylneuraminate lyase [Bombina bombina]|uniref:N-acetylneuraminate lyase n=1 Tax=Bombina bombina TaxID=8345 RepID=UPI00235A6634|nr:N-acetylneuraminate lyase [Bombina bombina]XP_053549964.1 N-acetylneuraminate lyase [Bombina bombina]
MASANKKLKGLVAATFTPMTTSSEINLPVIRQYVDYLVHKQNVKNIFVNGTTGEGISLSVQERKHLAEEWVRCAKGKMDQVIVHVGCLSLTDSKELATHAASCGADAISAVSPSFIKPSSPDALVLYLKEVAAAAPSLPFYYYHIPCLTGIKFQVQDILSKVQHQIPSFRGVKFTDINLMDFGRCIREYKEFEYFYGVDEQLLGALAFGVQGAVGSTYNYLGKATNKMLEAFEDGNLKKAQEIQFSTQNFISFVLSNGWGLAEFKDIMSLASGLQLGPARLPLVSSITSDHHNQIKTQMGKLSLL